MIEMDRGSTPMDDHSLAAELAGGAGEALLALRREQGFGDPRALRDRGDQTAHAYLMAELARRRPDDAVLSEEGTDDAARLDAERVWIVDPLDGTREFGEPERTDWAVHVALWERGAGLTAGAVALPAQGVCLDTGHPSALPSAAGLRIAVSRTRPPELVTGLVGWLAERGIDAEPVPMGSAGAKITAVLRGTVDAYVHAGGQYEWDSAAPVALVRAFGGHASRIDGAELTYNHADPLLPDLLVCLPELAAVLLEGVKAGQAGQ